MKPFSILIIVKNREQHLRNVINAIEQSTIQPAEIVVVHMNESIYENYNTSVPVVAISLTSQSILPLAQARNTAAQTAQTDTLLFLDVDCIPHPTYFQKILQDCKPGQLAMCNPYYLSKTINAIDFNMFDTLAKPNPVRLKSSFGLSEQYELFWSLGFGINRADYDFVGGFDEGYIGYGAEDTDFAFKLHKANIRLWFSEAKVYHQYHSSYDPPLNWLSDIISNARYFYNQWGIWPMEGWLKQFESLGYITRQAGTVKILKFPTKEEIASHQKQTS